MAKGRSHLNKIIDALQPGDEIAEHQVDALLAAQSELSKQIANYRRQPLDLNDRDRLDSELRRVIESDHTGLAKALYGPEDDRRNGRLIENFDTNFLLDGVEGFDGELITQRARAARMMVDRVKNHLDPNFSRHIPDDSTDRPRITLDTTRIVGQERRLPTKGQPTQRIELQTDGRFPNHRGRPEQNGEYGLKESGLDQQARLLLNNPKGRELISRYTQVVRNTCEQASSARFAAEQLLSTPGQVGTTNVDQSMCNKTLVEANHLNLLSPSQITNAQISGSNNFANIQAIVVRAMRMSQQDSGALSRDGSQDQHLDWQHMSREARFGAVVGEMNERAAFIATEANDFTMRGHHGPTRAVNDGVETSGLELSRNLPAPQG